MKTKILAVFLSLLICSAVALPVMAQIDITGELNNVGTGIYNGAPPQEQLPKIIGNIINVVLTFLGVVLVIFIIMGGFYYMTAGGDDTKVDKGKKYIINGIIGLVIILLAYAITNFVVSRLISATGSAV